VDLPLGAASTRRVTTPGGAELVLGPVVGVGVEELFGLFSDVVASGDGYPHRAPLTRDDFEATWVRPVSAVVGARIDGLLVGAYYLKPNFVGRGAHIANAGYVVAAGHRRSGVGRVLVEDSIVRAPGCGFDAIQFNLVFESNPARALYEELGFVELGRIPRAIEGEDAVIYWRAVG
jgi:ribosomal protein S18 acetylase RimI-like enzyme